MVAFGIALVAAAVAAFAMGASNIFALAGIALAAWLMAGALSETAFRIKLLQVPISDSFRRLTGLPRSAIGTAVAHFGLGVTVLGLVKTAAAHLRATKAFEDGRVGDLRLAAMGHQVHYILRHLARELGIE